MFLIVGCRQKVRKSVLCSSSTQQRGNCHVRVAPIFPLNLGDSLVRALGTGASLWPCDCGIDVRISSVTLLDPENDRGPHCYSPSSRNATDLLFPFPTLLRAPTRKYLSPGKASLWGFSFLVWLRHSESNFMSEDLFWLCLQLLDFSFSFFLSLCLELSHFLILVLILCVRWVLFKTLGSVALTNESKHPVNLYLFLN